MKYGKYSPQFDETFVRDFLGMKARDTQVTMSRHFISQDEFIAYGKRNLRLGIVAGKLVMGVKDDIDGRFIAIKGIPGSLTAEHIRDKRPVRWWQLRRLIRRAATAGESRE